MPTGVLHLKEVDTDEITLDGTLSVSGASTLEGATVAHSSLSVGGAATLADASATNVNVSGTLSVAGKTTMGGDIIPDTNDAYDIGSPEFKIRDLYVSNNSIWVGDDMKISNVNGSLKFRKRKTDVVPKAILDAGANAGHTNEQATADAALAHAGVGDIGSMKLQHWFKFMRTLNAAAQLTDIFRDDNDDYEESSASDAWKEIADTNKIYTNSAVGVGTSDPDDTLHVKGSFKVESETGFKLIRSSVGGTDPTVIIDTQNFGTDETVNDLTGRGDAKYTKLYRVYGRNSEGVGRSWYWGYANDDYTNFSLAFDGGGLPDPDIAFTFTTASELHCNKVYAALGGNADTATKLQTPRKINGVEFDGTQDITLSTEASKLATPVNINGVSFDGSSDIQINTITTSEATNSPFRKLSGDAPSTEYSFVLNAPRPGTTTGGVVHFINGTGRSDDGGQSTYTIRNDSGDLRLGRAGSTTRIEGTVEFANTPTGLSSGGSGSGLNMAQSDTPPFAHKNSSYGKWLYIGGWSTSNSDGISRIRTSNGNLHLDAAAAHHIYLNYYNSSQTIIGGSHTNTLGYAQIGSDYAVQQGFMNKKGCLTIGNTTHNYGGQSGWTSSGNYTACLMMECSDETEIAVHDSAARVASMAHYYNNVFTFGRDMGWGVAHTEFKGNADFKGEVRLDGEQALHPRVRICDKSVALVKNQWNALCNFGPDNGISLNGTYAVKIEWNYGNVGELWGGVATGIIPAFSSENIVFNSGPGENWRLNQYYHHRGPTSPYPPSDPLYVPPTPGFQFMVDSDNSGTWDHSSYGRMLLYVYSYTQATHHFKIDVRRIL